MFTCTTHLLPYLNEDCHIENLPQILVSISYQSTTLNLDFHLKDSESCIEWPAPVKEAKRQHELWKNTCFELFVALEEEKYQEWNFSPNKNWQAYNFESYRLPSPPVIAKIKSGPYISKGQSTVQVKLENFKLTKSAMLNPTAILKLKTGQVIAYAANHLGQRADFHDLNSFLKIDELMSPTEDLNCE